jgi:cytochrome c
MGLIMYRLLSTAMTTIVLCCMAQPTFAQNAENGAQAFKVCRACHQVGDGAKNTLMGPALNGIIGRKAGTIEGFSYSPVNKDAGEKGLIWTEEKLLDYLKSPAAFMPGNKMLFAGVKDEDDRRDIVAYLKQFSK